MAPNQPPPTHTAHHAPFTDTQITQLAAWQRAAGTSALMCGAPRHEHVPLIPDRGGLRCSLAGCSYTQTWAPAHVLDTAPDLPGIVVEPGTAVVNGHPVSLVQPTVHACPPDGSGIMPCCGRTPFEATGDQLAANPELVTCPDRPGPSRHCGEECSEGHVYAGRCAAQARPGPTGPGPGPDDVWCTRCGTPRPPAYRHRPASHWHTDHLDTCPGPWCPRDATTITRLTVLLDAVAAAHSRGPGQQRTPLGMVDADDVCTTCHTPWPCPTGRILTQHTQETS